MRFYSLLYLMVLTSSLLCAQITVRDPRWRTVGVGPLASRPSTCTANRDVYICNGTGCPVPGLYYYCTGTNVWSSPIEEAGGVGGSGTAGTVALWTGSTTLGNASITEDENRLTAAKPLTVAEQVEVLSEDDGQLALRSTAGGSVILAPPSLSSDVTVSLPSSSGTLVLEGHEHDAAAISSGVLPVERGGTGRSSWTPNRCVQVESNGSLGVAEGPCATGGVFNPMDTTTLWYREDFANRATSSGNVGNYGWTVSCSGGTVSHVTKTGASPYKKALRLETGATSGNICQIDLGGVGSAATSLGALGSYSGWQSLFSFRHSSAASGDQVFFVGYLVGGANVPSSGSTTARIGLEFDAPLGDTAFMFVVCSGSACTRQSTGVTLDSSWHRLRISSSVPGTIVFRLDDGSEVSISSNVPTSALAPFAGVRTTAAAAKRVDVDRWYWSGPDVQ